MYESEDTIHTIHAYFKEKATSITSKPCKANSVREFIKDNFANTPDTKLVVYALYNTFIRVSSIPIDKSYFEDIVKRSWHTWEDSDRVLWVDLARQKRWRTRRRL